MKNIVLSAVAVLAMSSFAVAGGDIAPVEPVVEAPYVEEATGAFYLGLGYGWTGFSGDGTDGFTGSFDENYGSIMIDAGYKFNQYVAVEGRYWFGLGASNDLGWTSGAQDVTVDSWGLYVKPMYPVTDALDIYALLGYGGSTVTYEGNGVDSAEFDADGFSWGIGAEYLFNDNLSVFIDYTDIINSDGVKLGGRSLPMDISVDTVNFGLNYYF